MSSSKMTKEARKAVGIHLLRNPAIVVSVFLFVAVPTVFVVLPVIVGIMFGGLAGPFGSLSGR